MTTTKTHLAAALAAALITAPFATNAATVTDLGALPGVAIALPEPVVATTGAQPSGADAYYRNVTGPQEVSGTVVAADPWADTALAGTGLYSSVSGNASATFSFNTLQNSVKLVWGSADTYNDLFFLRDGNVVDQVNGSVIRNISTTSTTEWVKITAVAFNGLRFASDGTNAFEFANTATTPVPLPAAAWMLIGGLAGLGCLGRKRRGA